MVDPTDDNLIRLMLQPPPPLDLTAINAAHRKRHRYLADQDRKSQPPPSTTVPTSKRVESDHDTD